MPSVNDVTHANLAEEVRLFLTKHGFVTWEQTYHGRCSQCNAYLVPPRAQEALKVTFSPTSLHIRANADRIAVRPKDGTALYYECKTGGGRDICIEALPLASHMEHARRGVMCLYCCLDSSGIERGFWAHQVPQIREIKLPDRWSPDLADWFRRSLTMLYPGIPIRGCPWLPGASGDPFIIIDNLVVQTLPSWRILFEQETSIQQMDLFDVPRTA